MLEANSRPDYRAAAGEGAEGDRRQRDVAGRQAGAGLAAGSSRGSEVGESAARGISRTTSTSSCGLSGGAGLAGHLAHRFGGAGGGSGADLREHHHGRWGRHLRRRDRRCGTPPGGTGLPGTVPARCQARGRNGVLVEDLPHDDFRHRERLARQVLPSFCCSLVESRPESSSWQPRRLQPRQRSRSECPAMPHPPGRAETSLARACT